MEPRLILLGCQYLLKDRPQLILAPRPAFLHVRKHPLEITNPIRQRLHFSQPALNRLKPVTHQLERFPKPLLERAVQLLIHRLAHLLQLALVPGL